MAAKATGEDAESDGAHGLGFAGTQLRASMSLLRPLRRIRRPGRGHDYGTSTDMPLGEGFDGRLEAAAAAATQTERPQLWRALTVRASAVHINELLPKSADATALMRAVRRAINDANEPWNWHVAVARRVTGTGAAGRLTRPS